MSEQPTYTSPEEPQNTQEQLFNEKRSLIENVSMQLGFNESSNMKELRTQIIDEGGEISSEILSAWRDQAEALVNLLEDKELFKKAQIGLLITKALVYLDANMPNEFYEDIDDATMYAENLGLESIVEELRKL
jgi:hypothetical protein